MKFEELYKSTFDQVVTSPDTVREVLNMKSNHKKRIRIPALAAAVLLICILATTAFAYTGFVVYENPKEMMNAFFGGGNSDEGGIVVDETGQTLVYPSFQREELNEEAAEEYVAPFTYAVGQSVTAGENKLTVDGYAYDANTQCGLIYMSLEMPGGFPAYVIEKSGQLIWQGAEQVYTTFGIELFAQEESVTETEMILAGYFYVPDYYEESGFCLYLNNGKWKNDPHLDIPLEDTGELQCITAGNGGIQIAPFAMVVHGDKLDILTESKETNLSYLAVRYADGSEYVILDENGEVYVMNYARGHMERGDRNDGYVSDRYCATFLLNRVVALDEVTQVIVDGVTYSVD